VCTFGMQRIAVYVRVSMRAASLPSPSLDMHFSTCSLRSTPLAPSGMALPSTYNSPHHRHTHTHTHTAPSAHPHPFIPLNAH
jgi:hypothetical protein